MAALAGTDRSQDVALSWPWPAWITDTAEIWWTRAAGAAAIAQVREKRTAALIEHARTHSRFYREAWRHLHHGALRLDELPVVTKRQLMARFDDWVTDPTIKLREVETFLDDRSNIGKRYRGRYTLWKSSGSTGEPGIYIQDPMALATYDALLAVQANAPGIAGACAAGLLKGGRAVLIAAIGDHFASIVSWQRTCSDSPWTNMRVLSVMDPLPQRVAALNDYQPAFVASYPTVLAQLASEQSAGRLHIAPACLWSGGECLPPAMAAAIKRAFGCTLMNEYGASECMSIACSCRHGQLHVNADWVVLEPVDEHYRPTPLGEPSHSVLLTNLANFAQPLIRYDLGDSIVVDPIPCKCGSSLPVIRADGRADDVVSLSNADGEIVSLLPLALTTVVEDAANVHRFQIVQLGPDRLSLRLEAAGRQIAWHAANAALRSYLERQSLGNVHVVLSHEAPRLEAQRQAARSHRRAPRDLAPSCSTVSQPGPCNA